MDTQFSDAATTFKKSGRWEALNQHLLLLGQETEDQSFWIIKVYGGLIFKTLTEYQALEKAYYHKQNEDISLIAWRARNLLELSIWSRYAIRSEDNARQLYEDAGRDGYDVLEILKKWGVHQGSDWTEPVCDAQKQLMLNAEMHGFSEVKQRYLSVRSAADQVNMKSHYDVLNKILSKLAHPTAWSIISNIETNLLDSLRGGFFQNGCQCFLHAIEHLEQKVMKINS